LGLLIRPRETGFGARTVRIEDCGRFELGAATLPAGSYTATVAQVTSAVSDGVPIQKPYTFTSR
jgi:hypothetical protein